MNDAQNTLDMGQQDNLQNVTPVKKSVLISTIKSALLGAVVPAGIAAVEAAIRRKTGATFGERFHFHANTESASGSLTKDSVLLAVLMGAYGATRAGSYNDGLTAAGSEGKKEALSQVERIIAQKKEQARSTGASPS